MVVDRRKGFNTVWNQNFQKKNSSTFEPFKVIQEKLILELLVSILHCKTMYCYQKILPSKFITSETERYWDQECVTVCYREDSALEQALKKDNCNFTKQDLMRSSSMTHCLQSSLRKRYAWKLSISFKKEKAQDDILFSEQIRNVDYKTSWETQSDAQSFRENGCNVVDKRVPGISLSTVQQQDEQRQHSVAKLIEMSEAHHHKAHCASTSSVRRTANRRWVQCARATSVRRTSARMTGASSPDSARNRWSFTVAVHRQGCRHAVRGAEGRSPWSRPFRRLRRFPNCNT